MPVEDAYARSRVALWLLRLLEAGVPLEERYLLECVGWATGGAVGIMAEFQKRVAAAKGKNSREASRRLESILEDIDSPAEALGCMEQFLNRYTALEAPFRALLVQACASCPKVAAPPHYRSAEKQMRRLFALDADALALCELAFINQTYKPVERCMEDTLEVHTFAARRILAKMLDFSPARGTEMLRRLSDYGILDIGHCFRMSDKLADLWEGAGHAVVDALFFRPLTGEALPLDDFRLPPEDVAHARALLEQDGDAPVHILLYGAPGTGKTTFARSLAKACKVKAWSVPCRGDDSERDRRLSLTACLNMAQCHKRSFVLMDEAERLLNTSLEYTGHGQDKAWINTLLEKPGQRMIWITNHIEMVDAAVRRRFAFSLPFREPGRLERVAQWEKLAHRNRVRSRLGRADIERLVRLYPAPVAVADAAIRQAKALCPGLAGFVDTVERHLRAHDTLQRGGTPRRAAPDTAEAYTPEGVCLEGSVPELLGKCHRVDTLLRRGESEGPNAGSRLEGRGAMLFYGPPGTGKTALARWIAKEVERDCLIKKGSDLLSMYVGQTEQQIAAAFAEAEQAGAVLVIDEADTFLFSRDAAQRSWESSMVNEFLTQLEACRTFCICTTNRRDKLDAAAMRRFTFKVAFGYAKPAQLRALYAALLAPLATGVLPCACEEKLLAMPRLTPGDFHAVRARFWLEEEHPTHEELIRLLDREQALKLETSARKLGF